MWIEHKRWVMVAIRYIERHLKEDIDYDDIARHTAVSRFHLHRIFMSHVGMSAAAYLRERRLTEAAVELLHTDKRILDIALEYCFSGQDSFTRAFSRFYSLTPQQYRRGFRPFTLKEEDVDMESPFMDEEQAYVNHHNVPKGWMLTGVYPHQYEVGVDRKVVNRGTASGTIKGGPATNAQGFGTLMQMVKADHYRGKRVRLTGFIKTEEANSAGMWMRIDGKDEEALAFDNMQNRPIMGTTDWMSYDVVLDVADNASAVAFGVLLIGPGQVWIDGIRLEEVDRSVPTTDSMGEGMHELPDRPVNLDFEELNGE
ncbi:helix-turn-helix transcriptional regulator [Paenibacillus marinisediminis]